ncbi:MAG: hypothetical protein R3B96_17215 [Pirellulaceae bacterium]
MRCHRSKHAFIPPAQRLDAQRRVQLLPWTLGLGVLLATAAIVVPKIWYWERPSSLLSWWTPGWLLLAAAIGVVAAEYSSESVGPPLCEPPLRSIVAWDCVNESRPLAVCHPTWPKAKSDS